jgi:hypothetical protein
MTTTLPTDSEARKGVPLAEGCLFYFPAALAGVAKVSKAGNDKHNPGQPLHHSRGKSVDHADCILRHMLDMRELVARGDPSLVDQILTEASQLCWRALALSQELHERLRDAPLAPNAREPDPHMAEYTWRPMAPHGLEASQGPSYLQL